MSEWDKVLKYCELARFNNELAEASMKSLEDNMAVVTDKLQSVHEMIAILKRELGTSSSGSSV